MMFAPRATGSDSLRPEYQNARAERSVPAARSRIRTAARRSAVPMRAYSRWARATNACVRWQVRRRKRCLVEIDCFTQGQNLGQSALFADNVSNPGQRKFGAVVA